MLLVHHQVASQYSQEILQVSTSPSPLPPARDPGRNTERKAEVFKCVMGLVAGGRDADERFLDGLAAVSKGGGRMKRGEIDMRWIIWHG